MRKPYQAPRIRRFWLDGIRAAHYDRGLREDQTIFKTMAELRHIIAELKVGGWRLGKVAADCVIMTRHDEIVFIYANGDCKFCKAEQSFWTDDQEGL